jgi:hypothetical protein
MVRARLGGKRRWDGAGRGAKTRSGCHRSLVASSVLALTPLLAGAQQPGPASPTVDLALSGGSAKGIAHIGVHVDVVAGTSMGAVVGGLYALGLSVDSIESVIAGAEWPARSWGPTSCASWST